MEIMNRAFVIAISLLVAAPAASATWYSFGTYEPDTKFDQNGPMFEDADTTAGGKKIYFNVYQTEFPLGQSINNGLLGSRIQQPGVQNFNALFGPWVDCNGDDAIGLEESALYVYPSQLLAASPLGTTVCPTGSPQNDGRWVYEYIPVGYDPTETPQNVHPMQISDPDALVWGDIGYPGFAAQGSCPISPLPHGTTAGTGWMLRYVDCFAGNRVQNAINSNDPTADDSLTWDCPPSETNCAGNPQKSDSVLNVHFPESLFGNPETGETGALQLDSEEDGGNEEAAYRTWNCGSRLVTVSDNVDEEQDAEGVATVGTKRIVVYDPTFDPEEQDGLLFGNYGKSDANFTEDGTADDYAWVATPAPALVNPSHSWADGANETFRGFRVGGGDESHDTTVGGDCDTARDADGRDAGDGENTYSGAHQTAFFRADAPFEPPSQAGKKAQDEVFIYFNGAEIEGTDAELFGPNYPGDPVVTPAVYSNSAFLPGWFANTLWATTPQAVNRNTLQPNAPAYWSFYAKLNVTELVTVQNYEIPAGGGTYGSEACGTTGSLTPAGDKTPNPRNGWECNPYLWNTDWSGHPILPNLQWKAKAHVAYQLRDVDCFDGSVARNSGVYASLVQLSPGVDEDRNPATPNTFVCRDAP